MLDRGLSLGKRPFSWPTRRQWMVFGAQMVVLGLAGSCDDIFRSVVSPPNITEAMQHAHQVVAFETAHGFFIEPAVQEFFEQAHDVLGVQITWTDVSNAANLAYTVCQSFFPLLIALWLYIYRRPRFAVVRNVTLITNLLAVLGYELYPVAPPRMLGMLTFDHRAFRFQDTLHTMLGTGHLAGSPMGYNPVSAMPSLHVAWALIMGGSLLLWGGKPLLRAIGAVYPLLLVAVVVVTANHYIVDAMGAALDVGIATIVSVLIVRLQTQWRDGWTPQPGPWTIRGSGT